MAISKDQVVSCLFQTVHMLADTIDLKESYTSHHQSHVAHIARTLGQIMCLDSDMIDGIRIGGTLHDFGIIRIPSAILNKPTKLTDEEFEIMKQHPVHGFNMLKSIDFPWPVGRMVLQHHERLDGSGYPGGIKGDDIIPEARIIAVADIIDSMITDRPYRKALSIDAALDELIKHRDVKYDGAVVDAAVELYTNQQQRLEPEYYGRNG